MAPKIPPTLLWGPGGSLCSLALVVLKQPQKSYCHPPGTAYLQTPGSLTTDLLAPEVQTYQGSRKAMCYGFVEVTELGGLIWQ